MEAEPAPTLWYSVMSGRVSADVDDLQVGDQVACGYEFDPASPESLEGRTGECRRIKTANDLNPDGYYGNAGFAEYAVKSKVGLYRIEKGIDPSIGGLLEPIASVLFGLRKLRVKHGETVVVIGAGTMGLLNGLLAREYGARAADRREGCRCSDFGGGRSASDRSIL